MRLYSRGRRIRLEPIQWPSVVLTGLNVPFYFLMTPVGIDHDQMEYRVGLCKLNTNFKRLTDQGNSEAESSKPRR